LFVSNPFWVAGEAEGGGGGWVMGKAPEKVWRGECPLVLRARGGEEKGRRRRGGDGSGEV